MAGNAPRITLCLWFDKDGETAARFYTSLIPGSAVDEVMRSPVDYPGGKMGDVLTVSFTLDGTKFLALNGGSVESRGNAASIMVDCDDQAEIDRLWAALLADGGKEMQCGWLRDRWDVPWQIVPRRFNELLSSSDPAGKKRLMQAMMQMVKMDVAELEAAAKG